MKKLNKLFLAAGSVAAVAAPVAAVVSCGTTSSNTSPYMNLQPKEVSADKTVLVTDGGSITDKSFNQQAAEALAAIKGEASLQTSEFSQPHASDAATIGSNYAAFATKATTVVAPGFNHVAAINKFLRENKNLLNFILLDGEVKAGNVASIQFNTKQPAFQAGYLAAKYLVEVKNDLDPKVGTWGGGNFPGVTDYMAGFIAGVHYYNTHKPSGKPDVKFVSVGNDKTSYVNSGFDVGGGTTNAQKLVTGKADIIMPVAGGQTADALSAIGSADIKIIGVDTDQAVSYASSSSTRDTHFLTSVTKNLSEAIKGVFAQVAHPTTNDKGIKGFGETTIGDLENKFTGLAQFDNLPANTTGFAQTDIDALVHIAEEETKTLSWNAAYDMMTKMY